MLSNGRWERSLILGIQSSGRGSSGEQTPDEASYMAQNGRASIASSARSYDASLFVKALYSFSGVESASLSFQKGDFIEVITQLESGWWDGMIVPNKERGWFPSNYVIQATEAESNWAREQLEVDEDLSQRPVSIEREPRSRNATVKASKGNGLGSLLGFGAFTGEDEDMTSFSTGADIFREIAGAAAGQGYSDAYEVPLTISRRPSQATSDTSSAADDWVPRVVGEGQIVFYNTRTGETARDLPQDLSASEFQSARGSSSEGVSASPSTNDGQPDERGWGQGPAMDTLRGSGVRPDMESLRLSASPGLSSTTGGRPILDRRDSAMSDDSALDAAMQSSGKRSLAANKALPFVPETPSSQDPSSSSTATTLARDPLAPLDAPAPPSLSALERKANDSISELIEVAHPRRKTEPVILSEAEQDAAREKLSSLTTTVIQDIRTLMLAADVFEASSAADGSPTSTRSGHFLARGEILPLMAYQTEIRPFVRKVTSTLSKLVLSVRAVWGLLGASAAEEVAYLASFSDDPELDLSSLKAHREDTLKVRADVESKLRWDVVDGAREVADSVIKFVDEVERLLASPLTASTLTPRIDRATLPAVKRTAAVVRLQGAASVPGAGQAGSWRANGFAGRVFPIARPDLATASTSLADASLARLKSDASSVREEVANMRGLMSAVVAKSNKRMSGASTFSTSSSRPSTPGSSTVPPAVQPQPFYTPLQSAARHMSKISAQTTAVLSSLGQYLKAAEDIDLGARVEVDLSPSLIPDLKTAFGEEETGKGKERAVTEEHIETFAASMQKAAPLLNGFERAKQALYDANPALLLAIQSIGLSASVENVPESARLPAQSRVQPADDNPLMAFAAPAKHSDPLAAINGALSAIETGIGFVLEGLQALLELATEQEQLPPELRKRAQTIRGKKMGRARSSAFSSGLPGQRQSQGVFSARSPGIRGSVVEEEEIKSETSSMQGDFFYGNRSTMATAGGRYQQRDSFASSLGSSRPDNYTTISQPLSRSYTEPSSAGSSEPSPQLNHSPSRNKLRKFFGDDAPPTSKTRAGAPKVEVPPWLEADYEDEITYNAERQVRGGTLRALVARLTSHESSDHAFMTSFLMTYRTFATSAELFDLLVARYTVQCPIELTAVQREMWQQKKQHIIQLRTINVFKIWIESHLWDDDAETILHRANDFGSRIGGRNAQQILKVVHSRRAHGSKRIAVSLPMAAPPTSISLRSSKRVKFLDIDPLEMARQLTLMDSRLCARITARECLSKAWPKRLGPETPNITAMTSLGNAITNWVVDTILRQEDSKKRINTIKQFVLIAERCRSLQNFSTLIHIVAGLYTTPIHRLRRTWDTANQRTMSTLQELNTLMSPTRNFAEYRERIRTVGPPCVPFVGVFLTSWTFIGDGNPDFLRERPEHINFNKRQKAAELIQQIQLHQSTPYNLADVPPIKQFLENAFMADYDDQVFYAMSLALEPRERDDDRVARLLSESGFL